MNGLQLFMSIVGFFGITFIISMVLAHKFPLGNPYRATYLLRMEQLKTPTRTGPPIPMPSLIDLDRKSVV